ncbi:MAG: flagellar motor protein [Bryobacter sp.]|jgi:chemotaxis protein MotA|nr:flagellar motor protein [Bryobacter sp. CoA8 C33]
MAEGAGRTRLDVMTVFGLLTATAGILGGLILEGGSLHDISQITAAIIVVGGTLGAVCVNTHGPVLNGALKRLKGAFFSAEVPLGQTVEEIVSLANKARKTGLVSLETEIEKIQDPFLRRALNLAVDGCDLTELRATMELYISIDENRAEAEARVFESAGGYAPTIGIIGAVLGLIQVMKNLADINQVGHGIAVAFVATVYGVALANVILLPVANKIKAQIKAESERREMMLEGVVGIVEGLNPKLILQKLEAYHFQPRGKEVKRQNSRAVAA